MRRKKHKHTRKAMSFYKINYGFHEPYKVLLDGNFIYATGQSNLSDLNTHIPKLLGGRCKLYTTKCITTELKRMGPEYAQSAQAARGYLLHKCEHTTPIAAADCIRQQIGEKNDGHWLVASQDISLRHALSKVPGTPLLFATVNGLHLETPSEYVKKRVKQAEAELQSVPAHERATEALKVLEEARPKGGSGSGSGVKFRRKKAKGPNPLAMKKKKKPGTSAAAGQQASKASAGAAGAAGGSASDAAAAKKRTRKRTKAAGDGKAAGGES